MAWLTPMNNDAMVPFAGELLKIRCEGACEVMHDVKSSVK